MDKNWLLKNTDIMTMRTKVICLLILIGFLSFSATLFCSKNFHCLWFNSHPIATLDYSQIEFESCTIGETLTGKFPIKNTGNKALILDEIRSNCACSGLEIANNGSYLRVDNLILQPGNSTELILRISARGNPSESMANGIQIRTNDPSNPELTLSIKIKKILGGIQTDPKEVAFGVSVVGKTSTKFVDIYDHFLIPRKIANIISLNPDDFYVQFQKNENKKEGPDQIQVTLLAKRLGSVNGRIKILMSDGCSKDLICTAIVLPEFSITPSAIYFPRASSKGPIFEATVSCQLLSKKFISLEKIITFDGVTVEELKGNSSPNHRLLRISCDPMAIKKFKSNDVLSIPIIANGVDFSEKAYLTIHLDKTE